MHDLIVSLANFHVQFEKEIPHKQMAEVNWFKCMSQHIADAFGSWQEDLWSVDPWTGPKSFNKLPFSFVAYKILLVKLFMCLQWAASPLHPSSFVLFLCFSARGAQLLFPPRHCTLITFCVHPLRTCNWFTPLQCRAFNEVVPGQRRKSCWKSGWKTVWG